MWMNVWRLLAVLVLLTSPGIHASWGLEPWADPGLPTTQGLVFWLDARTEANADSASGKPLGQWRDGSGSGWHAIQKLDDHRPTLMNVGSPEEPNWVVRFDGEDDHLRVLDAKGKFTDFTLFVVAAPHSNPGGFRGLLAVNQTGRRDYESGFTVDMNAPASAVLHDLNVEGRGFGGARNLLQTAVPFGTPHLFEVSTDATAKRVQLTCDGQQAGHRECAGHEIIADELTIGARHFENGPGPQRTQGFLHGDIAEVLLFDRLLTADETKAVRHCLDTKHASLKKTLPLALAEAARAENIEPLVPVIDPPPVQMLVPGFSVRELPLQLNNINNLRYRNDGRLYALGYDGDVWLLNDSDDDGLEDRAELFFENKGRLRGPIGMAVVPAGHKLLEGSPKGQGVIVASKGKVSALLDLDGDDIAETERVIASGWKEIPQNVDAIGIAIHPDDGSIYFGLGTAAYNNAYLLDPQGNSAFDLSSERGTIQRIEPDLSSRSTVCTGVRFTIGMDFDEAGQLLVTEQEGATWLPNGNPFDELLLIKPGRYYGFPPRHPKHLPNVFDEPSLFDYVPQHQSTCGMAINRPLQVDGKIFGPAHWRGDVFVCGESRGKLYRTKLVPDSTGECVARNHLIGCLSMLTVDCCVSPHGDLLVACHSGGPDWGTGPSGKGKLFCIHYENPRTPQPLLAWAAGPQEVRIAFDRPLEPKHLENLATRAKISFGEYVAAADRFESIRPGYAVTQLQQSRPRYALAIYSASITADRKTLILSTAEHPIGATYALTLPGLGNNESTEVGEIAQHPQVDLAYTLGGVKASWQSADQTVPAWTGWLPHVDLKVSRELTKGIADFDQLWNLLAQEGTLTLECRIDTTGLFSPSVQPGSKLDYEPTSDTWIRKRMLQLHANVPFEVQMKPGGSESSAIVNDSQQWSTNVVDDQTKPFAVSLRLRTNGGLPDVYASWSATFANGLSRSGPLALHRFVLPWAEIDLEKSPDAGQRSIPELAKGNWGRGRRIFFDQQLGCVKCHAVGGVGAPIGPDLSNLVHRDFASVQRDILQPSFAINPDYITYVTELADGRVLTGTVRNEGDQLLIGDKEGKVTKIPRAEIEALKASAVSTMPEELPKQLGPERMTDLLKFLLAAPPRLPNDAPLPAPKPRSRGEVAKVLAGSAETPANPNQINVLLVAGAKDHGPGEHDYPAWLRVWSELLPAAPGVTVATAMEWPSEEQLQAADTIVFYQKGSWTAERARALDAHLGKGGGLVYIHWAVEGGAGAEAFAERIGLASNAPKIKFRHGPLDLEFGSSNAIARNFDKVHFHDESYWQLSGDVSRINPIASGVEEGLPRPLFWTTQPLGGRVFVSILGHYSWTFDDPLFRVLLLRGIAWSAGESVDRFNELATLGVELRD